VVKFDSWFQSSEAESLREFLDDNPDFDINCFKRAYYLYFSLPSESDNLSLKYGRSIEDYFKGNGQSREIRFPESNVLDYLLGSGLSKVEKCSSYPSSFSETVLTTAQRDKAIYKEILDMKGSDNDVEFESYSIPEFDKWFSGAHLPGLRTRYSYECFRRAFYRYYTTKDLLIKYRSVSEWINSKPCRLFLRDCTNYKNDTFKSDNYVPSVSSFEADLPPELRDDYYISSSDGRMFGKHRLFTKDDIKMPLDNIPDSILPPNTDEDD